MEECDAVAWQPKVNERERERESSWVQRSLEVHVYMDFGVNDHASDFTRVLHASFHYCYLPKICLITTSLLSQRARRTERVRFCQIHVVVSQEQTLVGKVSPVKRLNIHQTQS